MKKENELNVKPVNLFDKGVLVDLSMGRWGARKKLKASDIDKKENEIPEIFSLGQKWKVEKGNFKVFSIIAYSADAIIKRYSIPFPIKGIVFVPNSFLTPLLKELKELKAKYEEEADVFSSATYKEAIERIKRKFPKQWEGMRTEYPSAEEVRSKFYFDYQVFKLSMPDTNAMSKEAIADQKAAFKNKVDEFVDMYSKTIKQEIAAMTANLAERFLKGGTFKQNSIDNILDLCDRFENGLNLFDDRELTESIQSMKRMFTKNKSAEAIRNDEKLMSKLGKELRAMTKAVEGKIETVSEDLKTFKRKLTL